MIKINKVKLRELASAIGQPLKAFLDKEYNENEKSINEISKRISLVYDYKISTFAIRNYLKYFQFKLRSNHSYQSSKLSKIEKIIENDFGISLAEYLHANYSPESEDQSAEQISREISSRYKEFSKMSSSTIINWLRHYNIPIKKNNYGYNRFHREKKEMENEKVIDLSNVNAQTETINQPLV